MRIFAKIRQALKDNTKIHLALEDIRRKTENNTKNIDLVFQYLDELLDKKDASTSSASEPRKQIGYPKPT